MFAVIGLGVGSFALTGNELHAPDGADPALVNEVEDLNGLTGLIAALD